MPEVAGTGGTQNLDVATQPPWGTLHPMLYSVLSVQPVGGVGHVLTLDTYSILAQSVCVYLCHGAMEEQPSW